MEYFADLHLHSRFARATSKSLTLPNIAVAAEEKGIDLIAIPDYTHPVWLYEVEKQIELEKKTGFYVLRQGVNPSRNKVKGHRRVRFVFSTEVSTIFSRSNKVYRTHLLIIAPELSAVKEINKALGTLGNLKADGRPMFGKDVILIIRTVLSACKEAIIVPAHIWTPWFSLFGSRSGFNSFSEAFSEYADRLPAVETGESSDPSNNWRVGDLDDKNLVSFSDAHSLYTMGREMTIFSGPFTYQGFAGAILAKPKSPLTAGSKISGTIEYYPEEGKYHYSGHRKCNVVHSPAETRKYGTICPVCGKSLTLGVMHRIEELATRSVQELKLDVKDGWVSSSTLDYRPHYRRTVPLIETIAQAKKIKSSRAKSVMRVYSLLCETFGTEQKVLFETPIEEIEKVAGPDIAVAVKKDRAGEVRIEPGFDGEYGKVEINLGGRPSSKKSRGKLAKLPKGAIGQARLI